MPYTMFSPKKKPSTLQSSKINFVNDGKKSSIDALKKVGGSFRVQRLTGRGNILKSKVGMKIDKKNTVLNVIPDE